MTHPAAARPTLGSRQRALPWMQLLRLPNVFTAMADILLGYLFTHAWIDPWYVLALLVAASSSLYMAGMVLNDVFDIEVDRQERPTRPLPSGRIALAAAQRLGVGLLVVGVAAGWLAAWIVQSWWSGIMAMMLGLLVVAYDAWLRRTPVGPLAMGGCRALNVLLGMSAAAMPWHAVHFVIAGGLGLYIAGVTWFSRSEAQTSPRGKLAFGLLVMLSGIAVVASYPNFVNAALPAISQPLPDLPTARWQFLMFAIAALIAWRCLHAIVLPTSQQVQIAVKSSIISLIVLDAAVCFSVRGWIGALPILALLIPTLLLGKWVYST